MTLLYRNVFLRSYKAQQLLSSSLGDFNFCALGLWPKQDFGPSWQVFRLLFFIAYLCSGPHLCLAAPSEPEFKSIKLDYIHHDKLGGDTTTYSSGLSAQAFQKPANNLDPDEVKRHIRGDALFGRNFSSDPTHDLSGLGPVYNSSSCVACHPRDGRGAALLVRPGETWVQMKQNSAMFLRISIQDNYTGFKTATNNYGAATAVPGYGTQLFQLGLFAVRPDAPGVGQAKVWLRYEESEFIYPDGHTITLRKPVFKITEAYNSRIYDTDVEFSPRMSTPMIGLGLLEAIPEQDIVNLAKRDLSAYGISGKPNYVFDVKKFLNGDAFPVSLGRFGLKANTPSVYHQSMGALVNDMGVTNEAFPEENIAQTELFRRLGLHLVPSSTSSSTKTSPLLNASPATHSTEFDLPTHLAEDIVFYSSTLGVPNRRNIHSPQVIQGAQIFHQIHCTLCHHPQFTTGYSPIKAFANQTIFPFTDMLLHDMGDDLADHRRDFDADGREWKTRPLWGLGHTQTINPRAGYLHDGRAKTLEEAIVWHGGEAAGAKERFIHLTQQERHALLAFLKSL